MTKKNHTEITSILSLLQNGLKPWVNYMRVENPLIIPESLIVWSPKLPDHREAIWFWGTIGLFWVVRCSWMSPSRLESLVETGALLWPSVDKKFKLSLLLIKGQPRKHSSGEALCIFYLTGCERHYPFLIYELGWRLLWQICFRMKQTFILLSWFISFYQMMLIR